MKEITITVTQEDIDKGLPSRVKYCPVARALSREVEEEVSVGLYNASLYTKETFWHKLLGVTPSIWHSQLPPTVHNFIIRYDTNRKVKPFTATLSFKKWR